VEGQKADRTGMGKNGDALADAAAENLPKLGGASLQKVVVTFAVGDDVMYSAIYEGVVIVRKGFF
jgi:hypothetical protein